MVTVIKKGTSPKEVKKKLESYFSKKKPKNGIRKYCGILTLKEDPLKLQKQWRDEWE
jgi:hypothetical protein